MIPKTPLVPTQKKFDLKILLVGNSGVGKTHFCSTYTKGPIHFYMTDAGGEKTLYKCLSNRPASSPITIDRFYGDITYNKLWQKLQLDEKDGFFKEMAAQNGLIVLPDSLTALNEMVLTEIAKQNGRNPMEADKQLRIQDWGQAGTWMKALINVINNLPCAVIATAHLASDTNDQGAVIDRYPSITGQMKNKIGKDFDEVYYLTEVQRQKIIYMEKYDYFQAKTRVFSPGKVKNPTLDMIHDNYIEGKLTFE